MIKYLVSIIIGPSFQMNLITHSYFMLSSHYLSRTGYYRCVELKSDPQFSDNCMTRTFAIPTSALQHFCFCFV